MLQIKDVAKIEMVVEATNADNTADFTYWQAVYKLPTATNIIARRESPGMREEIQPLADGEQHVKRLFVRRLQRRARFGIVFP